MSPSEFRYMLGLAFLSRYTVRDEVRWSNYSQNLRKTILVSVIFDVIALVSVILFSSKSSAPWALVVAAIFGTSYWVTDRNRATVAKLTIYAALGVGIWAIWPFIARMLGG